MRSARLAALLGMDRTTLTAALKLLARRGMVTVAADPGDRRSRLMTLTSKGRSVLARAIGIWKRTHAAIERHLEDGEADRLRASLRAVSG